MTRRAIIIVWLAFLCAALWIVVQTRYTADMSAFLPQGATSNQRLLVAQLRDGVTSKVLLIGVADAPPEALARVSRALAARLRNDPQFALVANGELSMAPAERDFVFRNRYLLSAVMTPQHFSVESLRAALQENLALLAGDSGLLLKRLLPADPTGETLRMAESLVGGDALRREQGVWFSQDAREALLLVQSRAAGFDTDAQRQVLRTLDAGFAGARDAANAPSATLEYTGPAVFALHARSAIEGDATRLSAAAAALVALLLWWAYRAPRVLAIAFVPVASGALAGIAAVSLSFGFVHGITLGFGTTMIGEAVDYALYFFAQRAGTSASEGVERIWPTLRLGTLTSVCGFSAMLFSGFPGLAQLGVYSVAGLVAALLATRWVLPILAGRAAPVASADATRMRIAQTILARLPGRRASTWALGALTACAALWLVLDRHTLWETDLANLSPASAEDKARDERLRRDLGAPDLRLLLVARSATQQGALEAAERASQRLDALRTQGELKSYDTPTRYLPSLRTQRERQAAVPEGDVLRPRLAEALRGLPFAPNVFEPFLRDVLAARVQAPLDAHSLAGTALAIKVDTLLMRTDDGYAALLPLSGVRDAAALAQDLLGDASLSLLDLKGETAALVDDYRREAARYALAGVLLIVLLLALTLRSVSRVVHVLAPLVAAVVLTCALLHGLGARLSLFHLVALLLVVGVGSNYALFFDRREGNAEERLRMAATLALCSATTLIAFGLLAFSAAPVLHAIGLTVAAGAVLCLGCSALIVRAR